MRSDLILTLMFGVFLAALLAVGMWLFAAMVPPLAEMVELPPEARGCNCQAQAGLSDAAGSGIT